MCYAAVCGASCGQKRSPPFAGNGFLAWTESIFRVFVCLYCNSESRIQRVISAPSMPQKLGGCKQNKTVPRLPAAPCSAYLSLASPRQNDIIGGEKPSLEGTAMEYLTVRETARKWNLSDRMVQQFCIAGRIPGAQKFGNSWAIPAASPRKTGR